MGSGSFGGGSGSFGAGGSGGGTGRSRAKGTDSAYDRILKLNELTDDVNANPERGRVRARISRMLRNRTRSAFLRGMLQDPMVVSAYQKLLSIEAGLRGGATLIDAVSELGGSPDGTLADLRDHICETSQSSGTDERIEQIVRRAVADLLLRTVRNSHAYCYETAIRSLGTRFTQSPLQNTADLFLGTLIAEAVRADLLRLNAAARAAIGVATHEIAVGWVDIFKERRKEGVSFREIMQSISEDYLLYLDSENE